jgi:hypothetical protein
MSSIIWLPWRILTQFRHYEPQAVTFSLVWRWLGQFPRNLRYQMAQLLGNIIFISKQQTEQFLLQGNDKIISRVIAEGLGPRNIIYVAIDSPGSSSGVMLNLVRDRQNMLNRGSRFLYPNDGDLMLRYTNELGVGAVVYVDDFSGSGDQFMKNRNTMAQFISGNFAEFFLIACICEEGRERLESQGLVPIAGLTHLKRDRPLHADSAFFPRGIKQKLIDLVNSMYVPSGLGHQDMAVMVILQRNSPDNVPMILRGSPSQTPYRGIFPRWGDLPIPPER